MTTMTNSFVIPRGRPFTVDDLEAFPNDGNRYELIDGSLLVSPIPGVRHQIVVLKLTIELHHACPPDMHEIMGPFAVQPDESTQLQPDAAVARLEDITEMNLPVAPLLAVEVLSPSTAITDLNNKKAVYQRMGVPSYWVVDPLDPCLTVFELDKKGFKYELVAEVKGDMAFEATRPFPIRIVPAELLDGWPTDVI
jgi:Uma2 family endonuclease